MWIFLQLCFVLCFSDIIGVIIINVLEWQCFTLVVLYFLDAVWLDISCEYITLVGFCQSWHYLGAYARKVVGAKDNQYDGLI